MSDFGVSFDAAAFASAIQADAESIRDAARPAAQAGAQVLYEQVKLNVSKLKTRKGLLAQAIYQAYSKDQSEAGRAVYHVSWNQRKAPHANLVEYGHFMRYRYYQDDQGRVRIMVRPEKKGTPKPGRRASQAEKDAYYVPLATPIHVPAKAFVRSATAQFPKAIDAARDKFFAVLEQRGVIQ